MISIEECRELLPKGENMSDEEIVELRGALYETAQLAFDVYQWKKSVQKGARNEPEIS